MSHIHPENVRTEEQGKVMAQIDLDQVCPFCEENLRKYHKNPLIETGEYWVLTTNQWPYEDTKTHLLAIARNHIKSLNELTPEATSELFELFKRGAEKFSIVGGTIAMRFGPSTKYASSVRHLHAHFIEPDVENPSHKGVKFPVSKSAAKN